MCLLEEQTTTTTTAAIPLLVYLSELKTTMQLPITTVNRLLLIIKTKSNNSKNKILNKLGTPKKKTLFPKPNQYLKCL